MKKTKVLALILVVCTLLTIPSFAAEPRASEQIHMHIVYAEAEPGHIYVEATIYGTEIMDKIGCQNLQILKMTDSGCQRTNNNSGLRWPLSKSIHDETWPRQRMRRRSN